MTGKILKILATVLAFTAMFAMLHVAASSNRNMEVNTLTVTIAENYHPLIAEEQIKTKILNAYPQLLGSPLNAGDLAQVEEVVRGISYVENAAAFRLADGNIAVSANLHTPIARIVNAFNQSYFLSQDGSLVPLSPHFSPRVMVVTGNIRAAYSPVINILQLDTLSELSANERILRDLFQLVTFINNDAFLRSFFDQIHITPEGEFELTPRNGAHIVEFGGIDRMEAKFDKLLRFYQESLVRIGWNKYSRLNLEFRNQIVSSK